MTLDNILQEIKKAKSIVLLTHENPDGDAVGSTLAMYLALKQMGKEDIDVIIPEYPRTYSFLPNVDKVKKKERKKDYDLAIALDSATIKMLNGWSKYFEEAKTSIVIDHHSTNTMYGDLNYVNPDSPACTQILLTILEYFEIEITNENYRYLQFIDILDNKDNIHIEAQNADEILYRIIQECKLDFEKL